MSRRNAAPRPAAPLRLPVAPIETGRKEKPGTAAPAGYAPVRPRDEAIATYDQVLRQFQISQNLPSIGWVEAVLKRLGSIQSLNGRDKLQAQLKALGYELL